MEVFGVKDMDFVVPFCTIEYEVFLEYRIWTFFGL